jgi:predicted metal-dependent hydrolase
MNPDLSLHHYDDGMHRFDYTIHLKPRMRHRYIRIRHGKAIVTAPRNTPMDILHAFVASRAKWMAQHIHAHKEQSPYDLTQPGATLYWRGIACTITIQTNTPKDRLSLQDNTAHFELQATPDHATMLSLLHQYRKKHAPAILLPRVEHWARIMDLHPTRVSFRRARTRWGSCSARNSISLNTHLLMLPDDLIDYVIIHELGHIQHKNHTKVFWSLVEKYLPQWKERRKEIRKYEKFLI